MTKFGEIPQDYYLQYYKNLPQIDAKDVRILWHCGYYDGPLDGICLYQGRKCWFEIFQSLRVEDVRKRVDNEGGSVWLDYYVRYLVVELSDDQITEEDYWHELFRQKIGTHCDYDEKEHRQIGGLKPQEVWAEYFDAAPKINSRDFSQNHVLGWFERRFGSLEEDETI
jgi:hypothetical protein